MCTKLAAAAAALCSQAELDLSYARQLNLDSTLFLTWAPSVKAIYISHDAIMSPGLAVFMAAAQGLRSLRVHCTDVIEAAQTDVLLARCSSVQDLQLRGSVLPALLPQSVRKLDVSFYGVIELLQGTAAAEQMASAFLCRLVLLPHLHILAIRYANTLTSKARLPALKNLDVSLMVMDGMTDLSLGWVRMQPCSHLKLDISVYTADKQIHARVLRELLQLQPTCLRIQLRVALPLSLQQKWQAMTATARLKLDVRAGDRPVPLHALPCSPLTHVSCSQGHILHIFWAAICKQPGKVEVLLQPGQFLHVIGHQEASEHMHPAWEFVVYGGGGVCGLPASWPSSSYRAQNAAAKLCK